MTYKAAGMGITLEVIDSASSGCGYDWYDIGVFRGSDGLLYTATDSGCSCSYFGDSPLVVEVAESWQQVADRVKDWGAGEAESEAMSLIERLMKSSPKAKE